MNLAQIIREKTSAALQVLFNIQMPAGKITVNTTKPEFEGDYTVVMFGFLNQTGKAPNVAGQEIGDYLTTTDPGVFSSYNVIKGFLNLSITDSFLIHFLHQHFNHPHFGKKTSGGKRIMVEYSSPNTNKPLHLGHLRNNFLGRSIAEILQFNGHDITKTCVVNDRGIHICKSMVAWQLFAHGATPESTGMKGDHFVGEYYVRFSEEHKKQTAELMAAGMKKEEAENEAPIMKAAKQMLLDWEQGKPDVIDLWKKMNSWVYSGFDVTYKRIGTDFDKIYYESDTYLLGKKFVEEGLQKGVFYKKDDGSVWIDLTADGLDEKLVLRKDGTSVYITQDIGLAQQKYDEYRYDESIYVIADEQNYHMKVLKLILQRLGMPYADGVFHLSYGMVELPTGRMKSREGTVVDADDLIDEMVRIAEKHTQELGKVKDFTDAELKELYNTIGLGALKFYLLRVDPKKRMIFNPEESIDFHGFTGPFIQYTHARIKSILRKQSPSGSLVSAAPLLKLEKELLLMLEQYPLIINQACEEHNPSVIAIYAFNLAKLFNTFYTEHSVLSAESEEKKECRLQLSHMTAHVIKSSLALLGIRAPERM
jgi:arginyl-tRNA synthetase